MGRLLIVEKVKTNGLFPPHTHFGCRKLCQYNVYIYIYFDGPVQCILKQKQMLTSMVVDFLECGLSFSCFLSLKQSFVHVLH